MAQGKDQQRANYPLAVYNFRVSVNGESMSFAKVEGLRLEHHTLSYRHGLSFLEGEAQVCYRRDAYVPLTFERGTTVRGVAWLSEWLDERTPRRVDVSLCDERGGALMSWRIAKAVAVKLVAPSFDASSSEVALDRLELRAAGISLELLN